MSLTAQTRLSSPNFPLLLAAMLLAACQVTPTAPSLAAATPTEIGPTPATTTVSPAIPTPTLAPGSTQVTLRLWTSPDAAPNDQTPGGMKLAEQVAAFEAANPSLVVEARIKKTSGVGGLLDTLRTASAAAPAALPDVIALSHDDLVTAANASLIQPLDSLVSADSLSDLYPMALSAARANNQLYGLPYSADALVLASRADVFSDPPLAWSDVLSTTGTFLIPAGDPLGLVTLQQYLALGGSTTDAEGKPALDAATLAQALAFYQTASAANILPSGTTDMADSAATWAAFRENRAVMAAAPASLYLRERDWAGTTTAVSLLPTRDANALTIGTAWSYALVTTNPARQKAAIDLIRWLTDPANVGEWTLAAGVLPPRSTALDAWPDARLAATASEVMSAAMLQPEASALAVFGPAIKQAVTDVLAGRATPQAAAEKAAATVAGK